MIQLRCREFDLPLRHVFTIAHGSTTIQKVLIVELEEDGVCGYGEACVIGYYGFTIEQMTQALESVREDLARRTLDDPVSLWDELHPKLAHNPFAQCALDQAAHDLWGKKLGKPVRELWGLRTDRIPVTNYTIGIDRVDVMVAKMEEFPGWPIYKIKLGTPNDLQIVRELRRHTDAIFRVDANCSWTADDTIRNAHELKQLSVEFIEQPLPADRWQDMQRVFAESELPIIADESCIAPTDVDRCHRHFHGVNIKLMKAGGLTPARRMIARARELNMRVMVGCMTESSVGISAIAQLLPLLDYVDMDGAVLLARDIASGVTVERGVCHYPNRPGNGVEMLPENA